MPDKVDNEVLYNIAVLDSIYINNNSVTNSFKKTMNSVISLHEITGIESQIYLGTIVVYPKYEEDRQKWLDWIEDSKNK